jgi:hypothetical protein
MEEVFPFVWYGLHGALISIVRQYTPVHRTAEQSRLDPSGVCAILPRPEWRTLMRD